MSSFTSQISSTQHLCHLESKWGSHIIILWSRIDWASSLYITLIFGIDSLTIFHNLDSFHLSRIRLRTFAMPYTSNNVGCRLPVTTVKPLTQAAYEEGVYFAGSCGRSTLSSRTQGPRWGSPVGWISEWHRGPCMHAWGRKQVHSSYARSRARDWEEAGLLLFSPSRENSRGHRTTKRSVENYPGPQCHKDLLPGTTFPTVYHLPTVPPSGPQL